MMSAAWLNFLGGKSMINKLVLLTSFVELELKRLTEIFSPEVDVVVASTLGELSHIDFNDWLEGLNDLF